MIPPLTTKIKGTNNHWSLISLNISGLNFPIKRHRLIDWICKQNPAFCCSQETHHSHTVRYYLKVKGWKKIFQANGPKKQGGVAILISTKIDSQPKVIKRDGKYTSYSSKEISIKMNSQFYAPMQGYPHL
jgi:exonuclease III